MGTPNSYIMAFDFEDASLRSLTNLNSFAEPEVSVIRHLAEKDWTLVAYDNANLDLMKGDRFLNIPDIKDKIIPGDKRIYDIHFIGDLAYLAIGFGIVVINPEKEEIKDTYFIGQGLSLIHI